MSKTFNLFLVIIFFIGAFFFYQYETTTSDKSVSLLSSEGIPINPTFNKWREFISPTGQFKVLLPSLPQHISDKIIDPNSTMPRKYDTFVTADDNGPALMISIITLPEKVDITEVDELLKSIVNDMLNRNKNNQLKEMKLGTYRNYKSLDFSLTNGELLIVGKVFANGETLYVLSMINKNGSFNPEELVFFEDSFQIIQNSQKSSP